MPGFDAIVGQETPKRILKALLRRGTLPHALLFTGAPGLGKTATAIAVAQACNCTGQSTASGGPEAGTEGCGSCSACRKIEEGVHPDLIRIAPKGQMIRIETVRDLLQTLAMKPYEARCRVALIERADTLNPSAGNALLKVLEEPPARTVLILTAPQRSDLLPTIVSRCQHLRFYPVARQRLEEALATRHGIGKTEAAILAPLSGGSIGRALELERAGWVQRRTWLMDELQALPRRPLSLRLALADRLARDRNTLDIDLMVMALYLRDLAVGKRCLNKIVNTDLTDALGCVSQKMETEPLLKAAAAIDAAREGLRANANARLTMDNLILQLTQALNP